MEDDMILLFIKDEIDYSKKKIKNLLVQKDKAEIESIKNIIEKKIMYNQGVIDAFEKISLMM